ncbi:MAG: Preprotein translocase subunit SecY [Aeromonas sp.]
MSDSSPLRFPKGWFALASVYSFTALAILASMIFSLLLFLSIDNDPLMRLLFGGLAILFEFGKFYVWYEYGERKAHGNLSGALWSLAFYIILATISIGGSIGGINSATNSVLNAQAQYERKIARFDQQILSIERQIKLNEEAARKYIELERIARGVSAIQEANAKLQQQQDELRLQRDATPLSEQSSVLGLMSSLADGLALSIAQVQFMLVCFLSVLLDAFGAFFVSLIGEEHRFRQQWRQQQAALAAAARQAAPEEEPLPLLAMSQVDLQLAHKVQTALEAGEVACSKRKVAQYFGLTLEEVDSVFKYLLTQGVLEQGNNRHYYLQAEVMPTSDLGGALAS